jgi:D-alanyl-lipoteichoic acid acyltransferase DltB (MBOAT superfamily)
MLFNSLGFVIFFPIIFIAYWFLTDKSRKWQNRLLMIASYFFYACWDYRFLFLLIFSTLLDFFTGIQIEKAKSLNAKKIWFWNSVLLNIGFLVLFKYYNFFVSSFADGLSFLGLHINPWTLNIIIPVGISFYTFHGLSYIIDIYNNKINAEKNFVDYSLFVSFFPLLVAGPIERATHLLPQIKVERKFIYETAVDGCRQILWGFFKKIVLADSCAVYANIVFNNSADASGSTLFLGAIFFTFQIYCDFSGYTDIAIGTAKLLGFNLLRNFNFPYFSRDIAEFWRRWHISLSSWFRDYLYIPLGGNSGGKLLKVRNLFIIFLFSGFWHGANWTFIAWGTLNAVYMLPLVIFKKNRNNLEIVAKGKYLPTLNEAFNMLITFLLTVFAWIFFRANSVGQAFHFLINIFSKSFFKWPDGRLFGGQIHAVYILLLIIVFTIIEWIGRENQYAIQTLFSKQNIIIRFTFYFLLIYGMIYFHGNDEQFIYFQF